MQLWEGGVRMKSRDVRNGTKLGVANVSPGLRVLPGSFVEPAQEKSMLQLN